MEILVVTAGLEYDGGTGQLSLLVRNLPRDRFRTHVFVLGRDGPVGRELRAAGIAVEVAGWTRSVDIRPLWALIRRRRESVPHVVHAWGKAILPALLAVGKHARLVVSRPFGPGKPGWRPPAPWALARADVVVAGNEWEQRRFLEFGLKPERVKLIRPGVGESSERPPSREEAQEPLATPAEDERRGLSPPKAALRKTLGIPPDHRLILCVGPFRPEKGFRDAIWAFDILSFLYNDVHLVFVGDGAGREELAEFARRIRTPAPIHWAGQSDDIRADLREATVVWIPSRADAGTGVALEAMSAGRSIVAARVGGLGEVVVDEKTGYLIPPGDKVALARQTRRLLDDAEVSRSFGHAGRLRVQSEFSVSEMVRRYAAVYDALGRSPEARP